MIASGRILPPAEAFVDADGDRCGAREDMRECS